MAIQQKTKADNRTFLVFFAGAFLSEIIFAVNLKIEICTIEISFRSIKSIEPRDLDVKNLNEFLIVGAKKRKSVHHLVIREVMRFKEIRKDFVECSTLAARVYTAGIDEGRKDRIKVIFKIAGQAEKGYIFADIQPFEDTFEREVTGEKEGGSFRDHGNAVLLLPGVKPVDFLLIEGDRISHAIFN